MASGALDKQVSAENSSHLVSPKLTFQDTLACGNRFWVRGQLVEAPPPPAPRSWWRTSRANGAVSQEVRLQSPSVQIESRIGGNSSLLQVSLSPSGHFEGTFRLDVGSTRRGWRVARHRLTWHGTVLEACSLVLWPPEARQALAVILSADFPWPSSAATDERRSELDRFQRRLRAALAEEPGALIYYLVPVSASGPSAPEHIPYAATCLGWPAGSFILLPCAHVEEEPKVLADELTRLRWLLAGGMEVSVLTYAVASLELGSMEAGELASIKRLEKLRASEVLPAAARMDAHAWSGRGRRAVLLPRYPLVFCHGMLAFSALKMKLPTHLNCFVPLEDSLMARGHRVLFPQVAATGGVAERAESLRAQILGWTDEPINIIAHSMGGLDARYLISRLGMADCVKSLTTVSTPHRGTYLADWFVANFRNRLPLLLALEAFGVDVRGFRDCRPCICDEFNLATPNSPAVAYFSYGGEVPLHRVSPVLRRGWTLLTVTEGPNDGMVSSASAHWETYLGTVNADHYAQTPDGVFVRSGEDFDSIGFFSRLVEDLARRGF